MRQLTCIFGACLTLVLLLSDICEARRVALIVGNAAYEHTAHLNNPVHDAKDMAAVLKKLDFEVILQTDASLKTFRKAIDDFYDALQGAEVGLFFYAGHGMQIEGLNYLLPVDADIKTKSDVRYGSVDAGQVLGKMEDAKTPMNIVFLDACRINPFRGFRAPGRGLARMDAPEGSYIVYATAPGKYASDGGSGRNGLFTASLLRHIESPGLKIEELIKKVRLGVHNATDGGQIPWESSSLLGDFFFKPAVHGTQPSTASRLAPAPPLSPALQTALSERLHQIQSQNQENIQSNPAQEALQLCTGSKPRYSSNSNELTGIMIPTVFPPGSNELNRSLRDALQNLAGILKRHMSYTILIEGHTDSIGTNESNLYLAEKRARAAYEFLVLMGVDSSRIQIISYGEEYPLADNKYEQGRSMNRRLEIIFSRS